MDGIFGVGIGEMIIIALAILVVGGPQRSREWARESGRLLFKLRAEFNKVMSSLEKELGPDGKELLETSRQLGKGVQEIRSAVDPKRVVASVDKLVKDNTTLNEPVVPKIATPDVPPAESAESNPFAAWLPDNTNKKS